MQTDKELTADLSPEELQTVAKTLADHEALNFAKSQALTGNMVHQQDLEAIKQAAQAHHMKRSRKGFTQFADLFNDWEGAIDVDTTGEQRDRQGMLSTLFQLFGAVAANPALLQDKTMAKLFNEIVETAGVSPSLETTGEQQGGAPQPAPGPNQPAPTPLPPAPPTTATTIPNVPTR